MPARIDKSSRPPLIHKPDPRPQGDRALLTQLEAALKTDDYLRVSRALDALTESVIAAHPALNHLGEHPSRSSAKSQFEDVLKKGGQNVTALVKWVEAHPKKAAIIMAGLLAGVLPMTLAFAPLVSAIAISVLGPVIGGTAASIIGIGAGGALASGTRSLFVNAVPMHVLGIDEKNNKQLATDVGMSGAFGFLGFGQAQALATLGAAIGGAPVTLVIALNLVGLVGFEVAKDFVQNAIRNKVASQPKKFRDIAHSTVAMESWSNGIRAVPGLGTNYLLKVAADILSSVVWNRIVNKQNGPEKVDLKQEVENFRFTLTMRISELYDEIMELRARARTPEEKEALEGLLKLRASFLKEVRPKAESLWWKLQ
jgi:hypothetical protein